MNVIVIDDELWMLRYFVEECAGLDGIELVGSYIDPLEAIEYAKNNTVDIAFIDMEMPQLNGVETAKRLNEILTGIKIVFVSAYDESHIKSMHQCDDYGYLSKPYKRNDLLDVINKVTAS